jgi:3-oxoadipate enol-lactonase
VLRDADLTSAVARIQTPTLVITGSQDTATPPAAGQELRQLIPEARLLELEAAHLSNVEQAEAFTAAVADFLSA